MDRTSLAGALIVQYNDGKEWDVHEKVGHVALMLLALEVRVNEEQWRDFLLLSGLNIYDSDISEACRDATNMCYLSGLLDIERDGVNSWIDMSHPKALYVMTDDEFVGEVGSVMKEVNKIRERYAHLI